MKLNASLIHLESLHFVHIYFGKFHEPVSGLRADDIKCLYPCVNKYQYSMLFTSISKSNESCMG